MKKLKFFLNKSYRSVKRFKIREKTLKEKFDEFVKKLSQSRFLSKKKKKKKGLNLTLIFVLIFVLAIGGLIAYLIWVLQNIPKPEIREPFIISNVEAYEYGSYGTIFERSNSLIVYYSLNNRDSIFTNYMIIPYISPLLSKNIYVLITGRFEVSDSNYYSFIEELKRYGKRKGYGVETISIDELDNIPPGSFVVIPSGRFPLELRENFEEGLEKGINFVYIGASPSSNAVDLEGNLFSLKEEYDPLRILKSSVSYKKLSSDVLTIKNPLYSLEPSNLIFGVVSFKPYKKGSFFVFPVSLDQGWTSQKDSVRDVIKVIDSPEYLVRNENLNIFISNENIPPNKSSILVKVDKLGNDFFRKYALVFKANNGNLFDYSKLHVYYGYDEKGYFYPTYGPSILPMYLSKKELSFTYKIGGEETRKEEMSLIVYAENGSIVDRKTVEIFLGDEGNFRYYNENLDVGSYVFSLEDRYGNVYARTIMQVSPLRIEIIPDFEKAVFTFRFKVGNRDAIVDKVKIFFDGNIKEEEKTSEVVWDLSSYFQGTVPAGTYYFSVESGKVRKTLSVYNPPKTAISRILFNNPINMALLTFSIILFAVSSFIKPRIDDRVFIDIPSFPPSEKIKVKIRKDDVIKVMEAVNKYYKWEYTPLRVHEIKTGFRKMMVNGNPLLISDFNLEYILEKLKEKGVVKRILDYYGLIEWEKKSGFTLEELALFRRLRDLCVEYTIPFTHLSKGKYNSKITIMFKDMYILFYTPKKPFMSLVRKSINLVKTSPVIILTLGEDEKELFLDYMSQSGKEVSLFRHYVERGFVSIMTIKEFESMLKEFLS